MMGWQRSRYPIPSYYVYLSGLYYEVDVTHGVRCWAGSVVRSVGSLVNRMVSGLAGCLTCSDRDTCEAVAHVDMILAARDFHEKKTLT